MDGMLECMYTESCIFLDVNTCRCVFIWLSANISQCMDVSILFVSVNAFVCANYIHTKYAYKRNIFIYIYKSHTLCKINI